MVGVNGASAAFAYHSRLHVAAMLQFGPARLISLKREERIFGEKQRKLHQHGSSNVI
ncbi:MAG: hypothetical protein ACXU9A_21195 [Xanthobacteraceae bacterium]